uniref:Uncharacterized protein n=1 Tax=Sphaerodactylus townsendi TaxID=933632 RepID=A0ACB8FKU6_9SAUR
MNAVLQCLSNTELFAEFLALEHYRRVPPPARQQQEEEEEEAEEETEAEAVSPHGEVTEQLAQLVRALWTLEYTPQHSRHFKIFGEGFYWS